MMKLEFVCVAYDQHDYHLKERCYTYYTCCWCHTVVTRNVQLVILMIELYYKGYSMGVSVTSVNILKLSVVGQVSILVGRRPSILVLRTLLTYTLTLKVNCY